MVKPLDVSSVFNPWLKNHSRRRPSSGREVTNGKLASYEAAGLPGKQIHAS